MTVFRVYILRFILDEPTGTHFVLTVTDDWEYAKTCSLACNAMGLDKEKNKIDMFHRDQVDGKPLKEFPKPAGRISLFSTPSWKKKPGLTGVDMA